MQVCSSQFGVAPVGHAFVLRKPLSKVNVRRCAICSNDVYMHHASEVDQRQLQTIVDLSADATASPILDGELLVGGFKSAIAHGRSGASVLNCAGQRLHAFLPKTRAPFDALRADGRCYDLEWEDSTEFSIDVDDLIRALTWARAQIRSGQPVVINCAQGVSRSGTAATAYLMACYDLDAATALGRVRLKRPLVQPNPHFMRFLEEAGPVIRGALRDEAPAPRPDGGSTDVT